MAETMIERVARALFWMNGQYAERGMKTWSDVTPLVREKFIKEARAAISEMREPTEAMKRAATDVGGFHGHYGDDPENRRAAGDVWQAMIDASLSEKG